jgi:hypothetical protein
MLTKSLVRSLADAVDGLEQDELERILSTQLALESMFDEISVFADLKTRLSSEADLSMFAAGWFVGASMSNRIDFATLACHLIKRSVVIGADEAISELVRYLHATELPCVHRTMICGVHAVEPVKISKRAMFTPWNDAREDDINARGAYEALRALRAGIHSTIGMLDVSIEIPKRHFASYEEAKDAVLTETWSSGLLQSMQATISTGAFPASSWVRYPSWCPMQATPSSYYPLPQFSGSSVFDDHLAREVGELCELYNDLDSPTRASLDLALSRLTRSLGATGSVDAAVDLRIAYEVSLGIGDRTSNAAQGELKYRLAHRASRLLGITSTEREEIDSLAKKLYDLCSGAIHTGRIGSKFIGPRSQEILNSGTALIRRVLVHVIRNGAPNWEAVLYR